MKCFFILLLIITCTAAVSEELDIYILDVGEGQAVLLSKGKRAVLIDTGHAGKARLVLNKMEKLNIRQLDYLFLTHLHPDHASGYFRLHEAFPATSIGDSCYPVKPNTTPDMIRWIAIELEKNPNRKCLSAGDVIDWSGTKISVLWPRLPIEPLVGFNHHSLVLEISHLHQKLLVMGDTDKKAESAMMNYLSPGKVDVLVVGHHGYRDSSSLPFLRKVKPDHAVISINRNNFRGYPASETIRNLKKFGARLYTTFEHGDIHFVFK